MLCPSTNLFTRTDTFERTRIGKPTLFLQRRELLDGEGRWETTLRTNGVPVLRSAGLSSVQDAGAPRCRAQPPHTHTEHRQFDG